MSGNPYEQTGLSEGFARGFSLALDQARQNSEATYRNHELELQKVREEREGNYQQGMLGIEGRKAGIQEQELANTLRHQKVEEGLTSQQIAQQGKNYESEAKARDATAAYQQASIKNEAAKLGIERDNFASEAEYRKALEQYRLSIPSVRLTIELNKQIEKINGDATLGDDEKKKRIADLSTRYEPQLQHAYQIENPNPYGYGLAGQAADDGTGTAVAAPQPSTSAPSWAKSKSADTASAPQQVVTNPSSLTNPPKQTPEQSARLRGPVTTPGLTPPVTPQQSNIAYPGSQSPTQWLDVNGDQRVRLDENGNPQTVYVR